MSKNQIRNWVAASNGTEVPFLTRKNRKLLYVWDTVSGDHAYLDCQTDIVLSQEEAEQAMGTFE